MQAGYDLEASPCKPAFSAQGGMRRAAESHGIIKELMAFTMNQCDVLAVPSVHNDTFFQCLNEMFRIVLSYRDAHPMYLLRILATEHFRFASPIVDAGTQDEYLFVDVKTGFELLARLGADMPGTILCKDPKDHSSYEGLCVRICLNALMFSVYMTRPSVFGLRSSGLGLRPSVFGLRSSVFVLRASVFGLRS